MIPKTMKAGAALQHAGLRHTPPLLRFRIMKTSWHSSRVWFPAPAQVVLLCLEKAGPAQHIP